MFQTLTSINCLFPLAILITGIAAINSWRSRPKDRESRRTYSASQGFHWAFSGPICIALIVLYVYVLVLHARANPTPIVVPNGNVIVASPTPNE